MQIRKKLENLVLRVAFGKHEESNKKDRLNSPADPNSWIFLSPGTRPTGLERFKAKENEYEIGSIDVTTREKRVTIDHIHYLGPDTNTNPKLIEIHLHGNGSSFQRADMLAENALDRELLEVYCPNIPLHSGDSLDEDKYRTLGEVESVYVVEYIKAIMNQHPDAQFIIKGQSAGGSVALHSVSKLLSEDDTYKQKIKAIILNSPLPPDKIDKAIENTPIIGKKLIDHAIAQLIIKIAVKRICPKTPVVKQSIYDKIKESGIPVFLGVTIGDNRLPIGLIRQHLQSSLGIAGRRVTIFDAGDNFMLNDTPPIAHVATALWNPNAVKSWMNNIVNGIKNR